MAVMMWVLVQVTKEKLETIAGKLFPASTPSFADCSALIGILFLLNLSITPVIVTVNMLVDQVLTLLTLTLARLFMAQATRAKLDETAGKKNINRFIHDEPTINSISSHFIFIS